MYFDVLDKSVVDLFDLWKLEANICEKHNSMYDKRKCLSKSMMMQLYAFTTRHEFCLCTLFQLYFGGISTSGSFFYIGKLLVSICGSQYRHTFMYPLFLDIRFPTPLYTPIWPSPMPVTYFHTKTPTTKRKNDTRSCGCKNKAVSLG